MTRIVCIKCEGIGWTQDGDFRFKCNLCDVEGFADFQDSIDYYTHINFDPDKLRILLEKKKVSETIEGASQGSSEQS
jgi:hypothetical protein|tara:strand:- start:2869 stop:3099 length:231 start_codon:yes stop_codon:yes gene_type:complete